MQVEVASGGYSRRDKYPQLATDMEVNNCFSTFRNSEIIEIKNDDFELVYPSQQLRLSRELLGGE